MPGEEKSAPQPETQSTFVADAICEGEQVDVEVGFFAKVCLGCYQEGLRCTKDQGIAVYLRKNTAVFGNDAAEDFDAFYKIGAGIIPLVLFLPGNGLANHTDLDPFLQFAGVGRHVLALDVLSRPLGEWDIFIGAWVHQFLPLAHVGVPLLLTFVLLSVKRAAPLLAGVAIGTAGYLGSIALLGQLATPFGSVFTTIWCVANALGCVYVASLVLTEKQKA